MFFFSLEVLPGEKPTVDPIQVIPLRQDRQELRPFTDLTDPEKNWFELIDSVTRLGQELYPLTNQETEALLKGKDDLLIIGLTRETIEGQRTGRASVEYIKLLERKGEGRHPQ